MFSDIFIHATTNGFLFGAAAKRAAMNSIIGTFLAVQWLRLQFYCRGAGSIPDQRRSCTPHSMAKK